MIIWLTGQPGSGKTTLANSLKKYYEDIDMKVHHIDGDDLRLIFDNKDYTEWGRRRNVERAQDISQYLNYKSIVIVSVIAPFRDQRENFKRKTKVVEVYVHTTDIRGKEHYHVKDYEEPLNGFIDIDTTNDTILESTHKIIKELIDG